MTDKPQMRTDIKHRELTEINNIAAVFTDRMYITPKGAALTIAFCEDVPGSDDTRCRSRIAMHVPAFLHFAQMIGAVAKQITDSMQEQQNINNAQSNPGADKDKVLN